MKRIRILSPLLASSCLLTLVACEGKLDVVDDTVGQDDSNLTGDENETNAPLPAPGGFAASIDTDCPCAQSTTLRALSCGNGAPFIQNDIIQTTADGAVVAFNLCETPNVDCTIGYWQAASGSWDLGEGLLIGLDGVGDTVAVQTEDGMSFIDISGESQAFEIQPFIGRGSFTRDGKKLLGYVLDGDRQLLARATRGGGVAVLEDLDDRLITSAVVTPTGTAFAADMMNRLDANDEGAAFRWTAGGGAPIALGALPGPATVAFVRGISDDGSVIAGHLAPSFGAFRWTEATGVVQIGPSFGNTFLSADGSVQLGGDGSEGSSEYSVYRWTEASGAVSLVSGTNAFAIGMSADGAVVAARLEDGGATHTFIWDAVNGTRQLEAALELANVSLTNWTLGEPRVLSADGKVLIGDAECNGVPALYRVELPE